MLAMRPDYVPAEYAEARRSLYDEVPAAGAGQAEQVLASELGGPPAQIFAEFAPQSFAAASPSQVKAVDAGPSGGALSPDERAELQRLRKAEREWQLEREILCRTAQYFAKEMK